MEGEPRKVGVIVSTIPTCGWRGSCEEQAVWAGAGERPCGGHLEVS